MPINSAVEATLHGDIACHYCQAAQAQPPWHLADAPEREQPVPAISGSPPAITASGTTWIGEWAAHAKAMLSA